MTNPLRTVLHVGCGAPDETALSAFFRDGSWRELRLDIDPAVRPDIVASIDDMRAVDDASVDALFSSHNLEHLEQHRVAGALAEFRRVLRAEGFAIITLPDLQQVAEALRTRRPDEPLYHAPIGPVTALDMIYGHGAAIAAGRGFMAHRTGFTAATLEDGLRQAGFPEVELLRDRYFALWAYAFPAPGHALQAEVRALREQIAKTSPG